VTAAASAAPIIASAKPASGFGAVRLGEELVLVGDRLAASGVTAKVRHQLLREPLELPVSAFGTGGLKVSLPAPAPATGTAAKWPAGIYSLRLEGSGPLWPTNEVPFLLAPTLVVSPKTVQPPAPSFELSLDVTPQLRTNQTVVVLYGDSQLAPKTVTPPANDDAPSTVKVDVHGSEVGLHRVRLRVDGVDSIPMSKVGDTFEFDAAQSVEVKP
jgi:hypothetical protein